MNENAKKPITAQETVGLMIIEDQFTEYTEGIKATLKNPVFVRDWREPWIDRMGLIVALSGTDRFQHLVKLKKDMIERLSQEQQAKLKEAFRQRFTPTNGQDGCSEAMAAVKEAIE